MVTEHSPKATSQTPHGPHPVRRIKIKKLPRELRRERLRRQPGRGFFAHLLLRLREDSQFLRSAVQLAFVLLCLWIGIEFALFVRWGLADTAVAFTPRPPGAEGFLPISALISLAYWLRTGIINDVHPSGLFIFVAIVAISLLLKKAFCSWLCPIGTLSESLHLLGAKLFGRNARLPRWLDYPLRSVKYLLLFFFASSVWGMDIPTLKAFLYSPYNKVADIKMYLFFANISTFALWTIVLLMVLSVFVKNFWCRYLCPYGAFLGSVSWLSPLKITRSNASCIDCELCTKACPASITVHAAGRVWSDECTGCLACIAACPVKDTLEVRTSVTPKSRVPAWVFGALVAGVFVAVTGIAILTGRWQNAISREEYAKRFRQLDSPLYQHARGQVPEYHEND